MQEQILIFHFIKVFYDENPHHHILRYLKLPNTRDTSIHSTEWKFIDKWVRFNGTCFTPERIMENGIDMTKF